MSTMSVMSVSIMSCQRPGLGVKGGAFVRPLKNYGNIGLLFNSTAIVDV